MLNASQKMKSTPVGDIPVDWEVSTLGSITKDKIVYGIVQAGPYVPEGIPYIRSTDVGEKIDVSKLRRTSQKIAEKYNRSVVGKGDIVFSLRGNIGESSIVPEMLAGANLTQGTARISVSKGNNGTFIRYVLKTVAVYKRILAVAKGSTFVEITLDDLRKIKIPLPPLPEQRKIAEVLGTWDRAIETQQQLIDSLTRRKKALMQQLLTGKTRLPGFEDEWQEVKLGDYFKERRERNHNDLKLLAITAKGGIVDRDSLTKTDTSNADKSKYLRITPGDIGYNTMRMWQGVSGLSTMEGIVSPAYTILTPTKQVHPEFAAYLFKLPELVFKFKRYSQGLVDDTLSLKYTAFKVIKTYIPTALDEQKSIAQVLTTADREISHHTAHLAALRNQKRGLMQQLLTGKTRVTL